MFADFEVYGGALGLTSCCLYGGASYQAQEMKLKRGVDIVVGTPGRIKVIIILLTINIKLLFFFSLFIMADVEVSVSVFMILFMICACIQDHLERENLDLSQLRFRVLDEADEMLRMGFVEDVELILGMCIWMSIFLWIMHNG